MDAALLKQIQCGSGRIFWTGELMASRKGAEEDADE